MDAMFMERLAILKVRHDLTYSKLAEMIGVTDDKAGNYLSGRTKMPMQKVLELSAALRIDANWLLRGDGISPIGDLMKEPMASIEDRDLLKLGLDDLVNRIVSLERRVQAIERERNSI